MPERAAFREAYATAFRGYLEAPDEEGLRVAYELGRRAVAVGLSMLDLVDAHQDVLAMMIERLGMHRPPAEVAAAGRAFLNESLATYDMASRGFKEASEAARLEQQHAERLRRLAEAFLELNGSLLPGEILRIVTQRAKTIHDAASIVAHLDTTADGRRVQLTQVEGDDHPVDDALARAAQTEGRPVRGAGPAGPVLVAPVLRSNGLPLGVLQLSGPRSGDFSSGDEAILLQFALMTGIALENAFRYQHERSIAVTLQRSLLPELLTAVPAANVACRYLPGGEGVEVGGDFYDVIELDGDRVALALGDVMGKGVAAAATMGQLRMALRAYATDERPPAGVIEGLGRLMSLLRNDAFATMVYVECDTRRDALLVANAGHPPPVLRTPEGDVRLLEGPVSPPLGVASGATGGQLEVPLEPGAMLVLYSDGLVEGHELTLIEGLDRLVDAVRTGPDDVEGMCEHLLRALGGHAGRDDTALLAYRRTT